MRLRKTGLFRVAIGLAVVFQGIPSAAAEHVVPLFLSASDGEREGFVRVINRSLLGATGGEHDTRVKIYAIDDSGWAPPPLQLEIAASETIHLTSADIEEGNDAKGLEGTAGSPTEGNWRLRFVSSLDIEVLAYVQTNDGMLTGMMDTVLRDGDVHRVPIFNPGRNTQQVSLLRLVNPGGEEARVVILGVDDSGHTPGTPVSFSIPAGSARSFKARELEGGTHNDVDVEGALGTGRGMWRLTVTSETPLQVMNLLQSPTGQMTNLSTTPRRANASADDAVHRVEYMPPASHPVREGFVRVVNHGDESGAVSITAFDDSTREHDPVTLTLNGHEAVQFNSSDLEEGNDRKGLADGVGVGEGVWRLELTSDLDIEVLTYIRTSDGFLSSMHDLVPRAVRRHRVATFIPGSNTNQVGRLRIANPNDEPVKVAIKGIDDQGDVPGTGVRFSVPANGVRTLTAQELESDPEGDDTGNLTGTLGDGEGKWQLIVATNRTTRVMSLIESDTGLLTNLSSRPPIRAHAPLSRYFETYNALEPKPWWKNSAPYFCEPAVNTESPWVEAGMTDLGGSDALSLIRWFGDGTYVRYGIMDFHGCTTSWKLPDSTHQDSPADPTYYTASGDIDIFVDIARVPEDAEGWFEDDGVRVDMSMHDALELLNEHIATYFRRLSDGKFRVSFIEGEELEVGGDGSPDALYEQLANILLYECEDYPCSHSPYSAHGAANRFLLSDVESDSGGRAWNGNAATGLVILRDAKMEKIVHEVGHAWFLWPHSYAELMSVAYAGDEPDFPNPYSNRFDFMSQTGEKPGWRQTLPATLAINRYAAGWIEPDHVALHLAREGTYTLRKPFDGGYQFLVVHSGRRYAFTTLEIPDDRDPAYVVHPEVRDSSAPGGSRPFNFEGVLVNRYDQTVGTGPAARVGPAFYDIENPNAAMDVTWGRDDHSLIVDGDSRDLGGGVTATVSRNADGSYDVTLAGGRFAEFEPWCQSLLGVYDTGCLLDDPR